MGCLRFRLKRERTKQMTHHLCKLAVYFPFFMIVIITGEYMSHYRLQVEYILNNESNIL